MQRVTQVQASGGTYKTAYRVRDNGTWQAWNISNPGINDQAYKNTTTDCNNATENNVVYAAYADAANRPLTNDTYFTVWAYTWDEQNTVQFACIFGTTKIYRRVKNNNVWGSWEGPE